MTFLSSPNTVYPVMDYIQGESLDRALDRGERFSQAQVVEWAIQLLAALAYLHQAHPWGSAQGICSQRHQARPI